MPSEPGMGSLISVIIPVYNVEPYIRQCLDSVVNQTYKNLEIIIVDDGSPDNCGAICDEYAAKDKRIQVIHKANGGVGAARNDGIQAAAGEWIAFADSDDWLETNYFEQMVDSVPSNGVDVICASGHIIEKRSGAETARIFYAYDEGIVNRQTLIKKTLVPGYGVMEQHRWSCLSVSWNKLYRCSFLKKEHIEYDIVLQAFEDVLFNLHVFERAAAVVACECTGYHYRDNVETSARHRFNPNWPCMRKRFIDIMTEFMSRQSDQEAYRAEILIRVFMLIKANLRCCYFHPSNPKSYSEIVTGAAVSCCHLGA